MTPHRDCARCGAVAAWVVGLKPYGTKKDLCPECAAQAMERGWTVSITDGAAVWPAELTDWMDGCPTSKPKPTSTGTPRSSKATPGRRATGSRATSTTVPRRKSRRTPPSSDSPTSTPKAGRSPSHPNPDA